MTAVIHQHSRPSFRNGIARSAAESAYPNLWRGLVGAWVPALGNTGTTLHDVAGRNHATVVTWENDRILISGSTDDAELDQPDISTKLSIPDATVMGRCTMETDGGSSLFGFLAESINSSNLCGIRINGTMRVYANDFSSTDYTTTVTGTHTWVSRWDASGNLEGFRDGVRIGGPTDVSAKTYDTDTLSLFENNVSGDTFHCDCVFAWNRALPQDEIILLSGDYLAPFRRRIYLPTSEQVVAGANTRRYSLTLTGVG